MNQNHEIPKGWELVRLGDLVITGKGKKPKAISNEKTGKFKIPYVNIKAFEKNIVDEYTDGVGCLTCEAGDFLMVWDGSRSGYVGRAIKGALGSTLAKLVFPGISNDYTFYFLQSKFIEINTRAKGVGIPHVDPNLLWNYSFPLPPLPEQHRIVEKIEALFSELDNGIMQLKTAREQLKVYRQAVLKWAFEGRLTEEWRKRQPQLDTADKLLEQINTEREQQAKASGKKPKPVAPLTEEELAELPELSEGWGWVRIEALAENEKHAIKAGPFGSSLKKEFYAKTGYKIYGQEQVISGDPHLGNYFVDKKKYIELESCRVKPKDVLISLVGTIGRVLILPNNSPPGIINPRLVKITLNNRLYSSRFFKHYFESAFLKSLYRLKAHGATMDVLNLGIIQDLPFPFCSIEEQRQIIQEIEGRLSVCDKLEQTITESLQQADALRQSILKKAFEGKLVPQDPKDESASVLLERIKEGRSLTEPRQRLAKKRNVI